MEHRRRRSVGSKATEGMSASEVWNTRPADRRVAPKIKNKRLYFFVFVLYSVYGTSRIEIFSCGGAAGEHHAGGGIAQCDAAYDEPAD